MSAAVYIYAVGHNICSDIVNHHKNTVKYKPTQQVVTRK